MQRTNLRVPPPPGHREVEHFIALVLDVAETLLRVRDWDGRPPFRRDLEWRMLSLLARHRGYLGISDLAQRCGVNRMCGHRTVRRLAERRLVEFAHSPVDRRTMCVALTDHGRACLDAALAHRREWLFHTFPDYRRGRLREAERVLCALRVRALHGHDRWATWPGGWP